MSAKKTNGTGKRRSRDCGTCGKPYYRSNRVRLWTSRNPGHRDGWSKVDEPICLDCLTLAAAQRVLVLTSVRVVGRAARKAATR